VSRRRALLGGPLSEAQTEQVALYEEIRAIVRAEVSRFALHREQVGALLLLVAMDLAVHAALDQGAPRPLPHPALARFPLNDRIVDRACVLREAILEAAGRAELRPLGLYTVLAEVIDATIITADPEEPADGPEDPVDTISSTSSSADPGDPGDGP